jgi:hypothetical protein
LGNAPSFAPGMGDFLLLFHFFEKKVASIRQKIVIAASMLMIVQ